MFHNFQEMEDYIKSQNIKKRLVKGVFGKIRYAQTVNVHRFFTTIFFWIILLNTTRRMGCLWISVPMNTAFPVFWGSQPVMP